MNQIRVTRTVKAERDGSQFHHTRFELSLVIIASVLCGVIFGTAMGLAFSGALPDRPTMQST